MLVSSVDKMFWYTSTASDCLPDASSRMPFRTSTLGDASNRPASFSMAAYEGERTTWDVM